MNANVASVEPIVGSLDSRLVLPGSKSLTNRALVAAALADGESTIRGVGIGDDTEAMLDCLTELGAMFERSPDAGRPTETIRVVGVGGTPTAPATPLDVRQSGTTARFVLPMLLLAGSGSVTGHEQMRSRPMSGLAEALRGLGAEVDSDVLPMSVVVSGKLGSRIEVDSSVSSQFVSGLLLTAPALPDGLELVLLGQTVSRSYISMTLAVMESFGAICKVEGSVIRVSGGGYKAAEYLVEPDASTAMYPLSAAAIVGGRVIIEGLGSASEQGDIAFLDVLTTMGAEVYIDPKQIEVRGSRRLAAASVDLADMSDTAPTFAALAARAVGRSSATGIGFIRSTKESDRVEASVTELTRLGVDSSIDDDGFSVTGGPHVDAVVQTYEDHRIAMAFSLLGLVDQGIGIDDPACVNKTYPGFFDMLDVLRTEARLEPLVLAIDGPAGSGKSTVAHRVSEVLRLPYLDTGAMYRSVTLAVLRSGVSIDNEEGVSRAAERSDIRVAPNLVTIDGIDVTADIRNPEVTSAVSPVAAIAGVRRVLANDQREWARVRGAAVVEGRDIGSAIFPGATLKIFLTASVEERALRRATEIGSSDLEAMRQRIQERDRIDSTREHDPLIQTEDAVLIDSTSLDVDEVVEQIASRWRAVRAAEPQP